MYKPRFIGHFHCLEIVRALSSQPNKCTKNVFSLRLLSGRRCFFYVITNAMVLIFNMKWAGSGL